MSENGGIGRHARLRTLWLNGCGGSTPPSRTLLFLIFIFSLLTGCHDAPDVVLTQALGDYTQGDYESFGQNLTPASNAWFDGMRRMKVSQEVYVPHTAEGSFAIHSIQLAENGLQEKGEDGQIVFRDIAIVEADVNGQRIPFTLSLFPEGWKLDLFSLGDVWQAASSQALPRL